MSPSSTVLQRACAESCATGGAEDTLTFFSPGSMTMQGRYQFFLPYIDTASLSMLEKLLSSVYTCGVALRQPAAHLRAAGAAAMAPLCAIALRRQPDGSGEAPGVVGRRHGRHGSPLG